MIKKLLAITAIFQATILLGGCLEHRFTISALPDQSVNIEYELRGDRVDITDGNELLPDSTLWNLKHEIEENEQETTYIYRGEINLKSPEIIDSTLKWMRTEADTIFFFPSVRLTSMSVLFGEFRVFECRLTSRDFIKQYGDIWEYVPEECRLLDDPEALEGIPSDDLKLLQTKFGLGIIQWNRARYERKFDLLSEAFTSRGGVWIDSSETSYNIARAGWESDLHRYLNNLDVEDPHTTNLLWWEDLRPLFLGRFFDLAGQENISRLGDIADALEKEYEISRDLEDDQVMFVLEMPGKLFATNGEKEGSLVSWTASGKDFQNSEVIFSAKSFEPDFLQVSLAGIILILIIIGLIWMNISSRRRSNK